MLTLGWLSRPFRQHPEQRFPMQRIAFYYAVKTVLPRALQIRLRQMIARRKRERVAGVWPILEEAGRPPQDWHGWPQAKRFALVLTHDVETRRGLDRCRAIMDIEEELGFRSAFNFVPARYQLPDSLRHEMEQRGFEVAVHGLRHDLSLFRSVCEFRKQARDINGYLRRWGAVGFRAPYMIRNLQWIRDYLDIEYDSSTFDTDPFEPQPEGVGTIFPFTFDGGQSDGRRYVELPCTLPQDLNLFVLLGEKGINVWKTKLDWIADHGGMALFDTHPDYIQASRRLASDEYPVRYYVEFLEHVLATYGGKYWAALPREVAAFWKQSRTPVAAAADMNRTTGSLAMPSATGCRRGAVIWIDLDNTPHVPFFKPIIARLRQQGLVVKVTARDAFQVCDLADKMGVKCERIGRHYGKNRIMKVLGLFFRALQMLPFVLRTRPVLAVSHGSRAQIILSNLLGIPSVLIEDYEFARFPPLMRPSWRIVPAVIPQERLGTKQMKVLTYPGIKEDVYAPRFTPVPGLLSDLGIGEGEIVVTVRPPATEAHYHNPDSERLFKVVMATLHSLPGVRTVLLPRNKKQGEDIAKQWPEYFADGRVIIPAGAVDGLNLIWYSDLVVSGGGTMNREAAALGVPVYSTFRGAIGAVDKHLEETGRLVLLTSEADVREKLVVCKRRKEPRSPAEQSATLDRIVEHIEALLPRE